MDIAECLQKGLLKKDKTSLEKAARSLEIAQTKAEKAKELARLGILDMAEVNAYSSMFHASRALLFRDGFKERSHYAIYVYLKEKYETMLEPKFMNELNVLRLERHEIFYGLEEPKFDKNAIIKMIALVEEFIGAIKKIIHG